MSLQGIPRPCGQNATGGISFSGERVQCGRGRLSPLELYTRKFLGLNFSVSEGYCTYTQQPIFTSSWSGS